MFSVAPWRGAEPSIRPPQSDFSLPEHQGLGPHALYSAAKEIDGHPDLEWSFPLFAARAAAYHHRPMQWQCAYESLTSFAHTRNVLRVNERLRSERAPLDWYTVVSAGVEWFASGARSRSGLLKPPDEHDRFLGRHSIGLISVDERRDLLVFPNSWGQSWGDRGFGYLSEDYFDACVDDVLLQRSCVIGPSPVMLHMLKKRQPPDFPLAWSEPNPFLSAPVTISGDRYDAVTYEWYSQRPEPELFRTIDLRDEKGRRVAWLHLCHGRITDRTSTITELFVWPSARRRGLGRWLEGRAAAIAEDIGSTSLVAQIYEADWQPRARDAALRLGEQAGYSWTRTPDLRRPSIRAKASRVLYEFAD